MSKSESKAIQRGIPPATEDDLKLDLKHLYRSANDTDTVRWRAREQEVIRLAAHHKREASWQEKRNSNNVLAYSERITTLEAALRELPEIALKHMRDKTNTDGHRAGALMIAADLEDHVNRALTPEDNGTHQTEAPSCLWTEDGDGMWETTCHNAFVFMTDGPKENEMKFCPDCGRVLEENTQTEETPDD